ncbi:hypothetical protein D3C85_869200 [compost metagenome]
MAKQFALDHRLRQRSGVDRDKRPVAPVRQVVQGAGHHFLASAGFTEDQHIRLGRRQCGDLLAQAQHRRRLADQSGTQFIAVTQGQPQAAVFQHQLAQGQGAAHAVEQRIAGKGFFEEVISTGTHGLHRQRYIAVSGDQQYRQLRVLGVQFAQQFETVHAGHADVADHHARPIALKTRGQALGFGQGQDLQASQVQRLAQGLAQVGIVVDQHYLDAVVDEVAHSLRSSDGCRLTPGAPARSRRVIRAPPSLWLANDSSPPKARIRVSQMASPRPSPWVRVLVV